MSLHFGFSRTADEEDVNHRLPFGEKGTGIVWSVWNSFCASLYYSGTCGKQHCTTTMHRPFRRVVNACMKVKISIYVQRLASNLL